MVLYSRPVAVLLLQDSRKHRNIRIPSLGVRQSPLCAKVGIDVKKVRQSFGPVIKHWHRQKVWARRIVNGILQDLYPPLVRHVPALEVNGKPIRSRHTLTIQWTEIWRLQHITIQENHSQHILTRLVRRIQRGKRGSVTKAANEDLLRPADFPHKVCSRGDIFDKCLCCPRLHKVRVIDLLAWDKMRTVIQSPGFDTTLR